MTEKERKEAIERFEDIIPAVFKSEAELAPEWEARLKAAREADPETRHKIAQEYVHALAVHIVDATK